LKSLGLSAQADVGFTVSGLYAAGHHPPLTSGGFAAIRSGEPRATNLRRRLHHEPENSEPFFSSRAGKAGR